MPRFPRNIVLIGARGAGKSTVGRLLAKRLARQFVDTDGLIEDWEGMTVGEVFAAYGEAEFREIEARVVDEVAARGNKVIAVGGGAILRPGNVERLAASGVLVWLKAPAAALQARLRAQADRRPPLTPGGDPVAEVPAVLAVREPLYAAAAALTVAADGRPAEAVADELAAWVTARGDAPTYDA